MRVFILKVTGNYVSGFLVDGSDCGYPVAFAIGMIAAAGALSQAEVLSDKFIRGQPILGHGGFAVNLMLRQVASAYDASVIAADTAPNKVKAFTPSRAPRTHLGLFLNSV